MTTIRHLLYYFLMLLPLVACQTKELKQDPFNINKGAIRSDIEKWGFELFTASCGFCAYRKQLNEHITMRFYLSEEDGCQQTTGENFIIELDNNQQYIQCGSPKSPYHENYNACYAYNYQEFRKDSIHIVEILQQHGGFISSEIRRLGDSGTLLFDVTSYDTDNTIECMYTLGYPKNKKVLAFEKWYK